MSEDWRSVVRDLHKRQVPAVVLTDRHTIEEGLVTAIDDDGFRIGPLGHWVWWASVRRAGEKRR